MSIYVSRSADGFVRSSGLRVARCHETSSMLEQAVLRAVFPEPAARDGYQKRPDKKMVHMGQIT